MVGSALMRRLENLQCDQLVTRSSRELDLRDQAAVRDFYLDERPEIVIFAAARVGGILANQSYPADFIHDNLSMAVNSIHAAYEAGVKRFLFLGSTCIYPRMAPQPIPEEALLTGELESTNEAYAVAKIAGLKMCQYYRKQFGVCFHSAMPTNLYGPGDNYHPENSHVLPALIRRFHEARVNGLDKVEIWGSGKPRREFLFVDDLADACIFLLRHADPPDWVNVGSGEEVTIQELAEQVAQVVGFRGRIVNDQTKPDGTPRKLSCTERIRSLGWQPRTDLKTGLERTYAAFLRESNNSLLRVE